MIHAHQVLLYLTDPVGALRVMLHLARPGGVVAARDTDYAAALWWPADPRLDRWLQIYRAVAHSNGTEPDAGRRLLVWAHAAGANMVTPSASIWCHRTAPGFPSSAPGFDIARSLPCQAPASAPRIPAKKAASSPVASSGRTWATYWSGRTTTSAPPRSMPRASKTSSAGSAA